MPGIATQVRTTVHLFGGSHEVGYFHCLKDGVDFVFVDHPGSFMRMGTPYGDAHGEFGDNQFRFSLFTYAALEAPLQVPPPQLARIHVTSAHIAWERQCLSQR